MKMKRKRCFFSARKGIFLCALLLCLPGCAKAPLTALPEEVRVTAVLSQTPSAALPPYESVPEASVQTLAETIGAQTPAPAPMPAFTAELTPEPTPPSAYMPASDAAQTLSLPQNDGAAKRRSALSVDGGAYTIAWMSDTQHYSEEFPDHYYAMTEFLTNARARHNLQYIVHTGDLVHNDDREKEWQVADEAQRIIDHIPNGVCAGNHDCDDGLPCEEYQRYFGQARYEHKPWYGGSYQNNRGHYDLIDAGNTRYIFVYMSYHPDETAVKWLNAVFKEHRDRVGVLCTHSYFKTDMTRSNDGQMLYKQVVKKNPNLYMVLCGHRYNQGCVQGWMEDDGDGVPDRLVYEMINNYQAVGEEGGDGYLRLLQMDEAAGLMRVYTYSPVKDDFNFFDTPESQHEKYTADPEDEEYELPIPWLTTYTKP